jgi:hypothetical protein
MYAETDFLLALIKEDDWLTDPAETVYEQYRESLWTSRHTLLELMLIAYREDRNAETVVSNASELVEVRGDVSDLVTAANYVEEDGFTPLDAIHLVVSGDDEIVSSDSSYDGYSSRLDLAAVAERD